MRRYTFRHLLLVLTTGFFFLPFNTIAQIDSKWTFLLDKDLSKWRMYLSYRHTEGFHGESPTDGQGKPILPIGYDKNEAQVFTVLEEQGEPVLRVSGEIYGCVFTKEEFENYHLQLQMRWGTLKWPPRLREPMDAGLLYHSQGECGVDYWKSWMLSQEFQMIEGGMGDYWSIASSRIDIPSKKDTVQDHYRFSPKGPTTTFGEGTGHSNYCQAGSVVENPKGEWNTLDLYCIGDKSVYVVNGKVVMALSDSRFLEGGQEKPLSKGKLQLQSEAAEVYYKAVKIRSILEFPASFRTYFKH